MKKIKENLRYEINIKKSKFIATLIYVADTDSIKEALSKVRKEFYDATHNTYAYILGENQEVMKSNDDGEPQGTAGQPILNVLKNNNLTNILVIVTRYFGGIKLGASGLIRAYGGVVAEAVKEAKFFCSKELLVYSLRLSYSLYNKILRELSCHQIIDTVFSDDVLVKIGVMAEKKDAFTSFCLSQDEQINLVYLSKSSLEVDV